MDEQHYKDALLRKRSEILATGGIKPLQASMENNSRQGDMADQASGNNEVHIQLKLKQTDAKILQAIEEALVRIDKGTYGVCRDCGEPIVAGAAERDPVDARLHHLQGKAELVNRPTCSRCSRTFYRREAGALQRATRRARCIVGHTTFNNTYQYIIDREETQHLAGCATRSPSWAAGPGRRRRPSSPRVRQGRRRRRARSSRRTPRTRERVRRRVAAARRRR